MEVDGEQQEQMDTRTLTEDEAAEIAYYEEGQRAQQEVGDQRGEVGTRTLTVAEITQAHHERQRAQQARWHGQGAPAAQEMGPAAAAEEGSEGLSDAGDRRGDDVKIISGEELIEDATHSMAAVQLDVEAPMIDPDAVVTVLEKIGTDRGNFGGTPPENMDKGWRVSWEQLTAVGDSTVDALVVTNPSRGKMDYMFEYMKAMGGYPLAGVVYKFERLGAARAIAAGMMGKVDMEQGMTKTKTKVPSRMRLNLGSTGVMRDNVKSAIAALVEIVEAGGGTVAFVVMSNKRAPDGSFLPEGSGMLIVGLRGLPSGWAYPEKLQYRNVFNTGDAGQIKTLWSSTGQFIEHPADSYARKMAGGLEACNNCRVLTGGHKAFPAGARCLFDKTVTAAPPPTYTPNYSMAQYRTDLMKWVAEDASPSELEGLRPSWCRGCIEVGVRCDPGKRCLKVPCRMIERGDQAEVDARPHGSA